MEWYVYYHNYNAQKIVTWNIFNHWKFTEEVEKLLHTKLNKEEFAEKLQRELFYYFGSKCEYEIIINPWCGEADEIKVDTYEQVKMNLDKFVDYVWSFRKDKRNG